MSEAIELKEDGFVEIAMHDASIKIDLFRTWDEMVEIHKNNDDSHRAECYKGYLVSLGYPDTISHRLVDKFIETVGRMCEELKKKDGEGSSDSESADSPNSTD